MSLFFGRIVLRLPGPGIPLRNVLVFERFLAEFWPASYVGGLGLSLMTSRSQSSGWHGCLSSAGVGVREQVVALLLPPSEAGAGQCFQRLVLS